MHAPQSGLPAGLSSFPAIHALSPVGNLETVALSATNGAIEFFCYPHFDSPSLFASLLDRERGGHFAVTLAGAGEGTQRYEPDTNVLVTRLESDDAAIEITDFMPLGRDAATNQLVRIVTAVRGTASVSALCRPAFDYGRSEMCAEARDERAVLFTDDNGSLPVRLCASAPLRVSGNGAEVSLTLEEGERLVLNLVCDNADTDLLTEGRIDASLAETTRWWREWAASGTYDGRWRDIVTRSALALKLMVSNTHGSIVAAPTFGLPEAIGGERNWDYRYCWMRDSAFTVYAMLRLGFREEAHAYRAWTHARLDACDNGFLQLVYRLDGDTDGLDERTLEHFGGYKGSAPVRIGNGAFGQSQLDIYGEVVDSLYLSSKHLDVDPADDYDRLANIVDYVCANWREKGSGMWEMRGPPRAFLDARFLCWVAVDRAIRMGDKHGFAIPDHWHATRDDLHASVEAQFWNADIGAFTQTAGGTTVDAAALLMPLVKFVAPTDEKFLSTMRVIGERLKTGPFVRRYEPPEDGTEGLGDGPEEGAFLACSFWYAECLARTGRVVEGREMFEALLAHASPTGLFAEEIATDGTHLGNTPQGLPHLALISAAVALDRAIKNGGEPF